MNEKILKDFVENIDKYVPNINCTDRFTWLVDDLKDIVLNNGKPKWKQHEEEVWLHIKYFMKILWQVII